MKTTRYSSGLIMAASAFLIWGFLPIYWKAVKMVPPIEVLCHRMVWSVPFTALIITFQGRWRETFGAVADKKTLLMLLLSSSLIGVNWYLYIWAVNTGHVVESSLGYFINPLVNVLLGYLFFRDRLKSIQRVAIGLAALGVSYSVVGYGSVPWISLALAFSFGLYGLVRKLVRIESLPGLFCETFILGIPAGSFLFCRFAEGTGSLFSLSADIDLLLVGAGAVTSIPLVLFATGARRITLTTLGILQYVAPTCMFLLGVLAYNEPFDTQRLIAFLFIWAGVGVYLYDGVRCLGRNSGR